MKKLLSAMLMVCVPSVALADNGLCGSEPCDFDGLALLAWGVVTVETVPLGFALADVLAQPQSKVYGGLEVGFGGLAAALNTALLVGHGELDSVGVALAGLLAIDLAVVAHGTILLVRDRPDSGPRLIPSAVSTQTGFAPALGLTGTF